jgi:hypothetical protein
MTYIQATVKSMYFLKLRFSEKATKQWYNLHLSIQFWASTLVYRIDMQYKKIPPCMVLFLSVRLLILRKIPTCTFFLYCMSIRYTRVLAQNWILRWRLYHCFVAFSENLNFKKYIDFTVACMYVIQWHSQIKIGLLLNLRVCMGIASNLKVS